MALRTEQGNEMPKTVLHTKSSIFDTATDEWLKQEAEAVADSSMMLAWYRVVVDEFVEMLLYQNVTEWGDILPAHVGISFAVSRDFRVSGEHSRLLADASGRKIEHDPEAIQKVMLLRLEVLKKFLTFCCAAGYVGIELLSMSWQPDYLTQLANGKGLG
jgi:hypothetical protein